MTRNDKKVYRVVGDYEIKLQENKWVCIIDRTDSEDECIVLHVDEVNEMIKALQEVKEQVAGET